MTLPTEFIEHHVPRESGRVHARDYPGAEPAFVMMHGFPDNLHIYDELVPHLLAAGRRVVTFDFLGFGASDKPSDVAYSFAQQAGDLMAVVDHLRLDKIVPVVHDSSGPTGINFALDHPGRVAWLCILNSGYDDAVDILWPEMITLFATKSLGALAMAIAQTPAQFGWLLKWQQAGFRTPLTPAQQAGFDAVTGPLIADNFIQPPSSGPAFVQLAAQFFDELARNTRRLPELERLTIATKVIWGELDPYITAAVARDRVSHFEHGTLHLLPGGHWIQSDLPEQVAQAMLA